MSSSERDSITEIYNYYLNWDREWNYGGFIKDYMTFTDKIIIDQFIEQPEEILQQQIKANGDDKNLIMEWLITFAPIDILDNMVTQLKSRHPTMVLFIHAHGEFANTKFGTYFKDMSNYVSSMKFTMESPFDTCSYSSQKDAEEKNSVICNVYNNYQLESAFDITRKILRTTTGDLMGILKQEVNNLPPDKHISVQHLIDIESANELLPEPIVGERNYWASHTFQSNENINKIYTFTNEPSIERGIFVAHTSGLAGLQMSCERKNSFIQILKIIIDKQKDNPEYTEKHHRLIPKLFNMCNYESRDEMDETESRATPIALSIIVNLTFALGIKLEIFDSSCGQIYQSVDIDTNPMSILKRNLSTGGYQTSRRKSKSRKSRKSKSRKSKSRKSKSRKSRKSRKRII